MKQIDRFLLAIIAGIVLLVIAALALAFTRSPQDYLADTTPGNVAHNYVLAFKQRDDERAYGYLSPEIPGYPASRDAFSADVDRDRWSFNRESATVSVGDERITGDRAIVTVTETYFSEGGLFSSGQYTSSFNVTLRRAGETWKIVSADSYWSSCWADDRPCE